MFPDIEITPFCNLFTEKCVNIVFERDETYSMAGCVTFCFDNCFLNAPGTESVINQFETPISIVGECY